jgi:hypothetical protein
MGESIVIEPTATGKGSFAERTMRVAVLLLLFGLLAPSGMSVAWPTESFGAPSRYREDRKGIPVGNGP